MEQRRISIKVGDVQLTASLNDSPTADMVWEALPIRSSASTWGDEIYLRTPVRTSEDGNAQEVVDKGAVAYWPPGEALCVFWGPTPASQGDEIRAASAVNVIGEVEGDAAVLDGVRSGSPVVDRA